jgi:hypothetical protein
MLSSLFVIVFFVWWAPHYVNAAESHGFTYTSMTEQTAVGESGVQYHYYRFFDLWGSYVGMVVYAHDRQTRGLASVGTALFPNKAGKVNLSCFDDAPIGTTYLMTNNPGRAELAAYDRCRIDARAGVAMQSR